jgi:hypothetical protein
MWQPIVGRLTSWEEFGSGRAPNGILCRDLPGMTEEYDG